MIQKGGQYDRRESTARGKRWGRLLFAVLLLAFELPSFCQLFQSIRKLNGSTGFEQFAGPSSLDQNDCINGSLFALCWQL